MDALKIQDLEKKIEGLSHQVIDQFKRWKHLVPDSITLYNADESILDTFKTIFGKSLASEGYTMPLVIRTKEEGYSIDVNGYLKIK